MPRALMLKLDHLKSRHCQRYLRWFKEGKKDGLCGICRGDDEVPRRVREAYINGHAYGMITRMEA